MSRPLLFKLSARHEFEEAVVWYESARAGLGQEFAREVGRALERARANPGMFRRVRGGARKIRLRRFGKYSIYFAVKEDVFAVLAVFHGARNPADLQQRLG